MDLPCLWLGRLRHTFVLVFIAHLLALLKEDLNLLLLAILLTYYCKREMKREMGYVVPRIQDQGCFHNSNKEKERRRIAGYSISSNGMQKWYASRVCCVSSQKDQEESTQVKVSINMLTLKIEELF